MEKTIMKNIMIVVACIFGLFVVTMGFKVASVNLSSNISKQVERYGGMVESLEELVKKAGTKNPSLERAKILYKKAKGYRTSGLAGVALAVLTIFVVIMMFLKNNQLLLLGGGILVFAVLLFVMLAPGVAIGTYAAASPRNQVLLLGVPAIIAAVAAFRAVKIGQSD